MIRRSWSVDSFPRSLVLFSPLPVKPRGWGGGRGGGSIVFIIVLRSFCPYIHGVNFLIYFRYSLANWSETYRVALYRENTAVCQIKVCRQEIVIISLLNLSSGDACIMKSIINDTAISIIHSQLHKR